MAQSVTTADLRRELATALDALRKDANASTESLADKLASVLEAFVDTRVARSHDASWTGEGLPASATGGDF